MTDPSRTLSFDDYMAPVPLEQVAEILSDWTWCVPANHRPVGITLFGDVLLVDPGNRIFLLDTAFGVYERVAEGNDDFRAKLANPAFLQYLLRIELADRAMKSPVGDPQNDSSIGRPRASEIFAFRIPLIVGGQSTLDNLVRMPPHVPLAMASMLARQLEAVPPGTPVRMDFRNFPGRPAGPPGGPNGALIRAARRR